VGSTIAFRRSHLFFVSTKPLGRMESTFTSRLSGRRSLLVVRTDASTMAYFLNFRSSSKSRNGIGYRRVHLPLSTSTPPTQTVSPRFVLGLGVALIAIRKRRVCQSRLDVADLELTTVALGYNGGQQ